MCFRRVAVFGVGLIGGSIAAGLKKRGFKGRIVGVGRSVARLQGAIDAGLIDEATDDPRRAAANSDLLVFCTPVDQIATGVKAAAAHCPPGTLITDGGSVKGRLVAALEGALPPAVRFIGSHPLAGSEKTGYEHANPDLFEKRLCVITPTESSPRDQVDRLAAFWQFLGMRVVEMSAAAHDAALAVTSHAPHVIAAALAALLKEPLRPFAASGFCDTTRIAAGDPDLWVAILEHNATDVVAALDAFAGELARFRDAIAARDPAALKSLLEVAKRNRDAIADRSTSRTT